MFVINCHPLRRTKSDIGLYHQFFILLVPCVLRVQSEGWGSLVDVW